MASPEAKASMAKSAIGSPDCRGSTLVELLVALVIATVMLGAATMAFPRSDVRRAEQAAARARGLVELACERAELTGEDIGIVAGDGRIAFGSLRNGEWQAFADSPREPLRPRLLDAEVALELQVDAQVPVVRQEGGADAAVLCPASGESMPFVLELRGPGRQRWSLRGDGDGNLQQVDGNAQ